MADGSVKFDTKFDTSGFSKGMSIVTKALGGLSFAAITKEIIELGSSFEISFAKASTLFGDVTVDTENLNKKIKEMSNSTGVAGTELNETLYQAMSAGIPVTEDMSEALEAVNVAAKLSKGGFTSSATAMSALTTAVNAYKLPASDATKIADELITVQNKGVTTVDELASNMGKGISTASAYNVNLENLNAGYIALTKSGISTAESTTYLAGMFNELGDSGSDVSKVLQEETGMTFGQMMQGGYDLADVMDILTESVDGDAEALMNLWGSQEAGKAANAIVQQGTDNFRQSLDDLTNSSGATEAAYSTMMDTFDGKASKLKETASNLAVSIFEEVEPALDAVLDGLQWIADNAEILIPFITALAVAFIAFKIQLLAAEAAEEGVTIAQYLLNTSMLACPLTWIVLAIAALVAAFIYLWNNCEEFRNFWINLWENIKTIFLTVWEAVKSFFTEKIPEMFNNLMQWFKNLPENIAYWLGFALGKIAVWCATLPVKAYEAGKAFLQNVINFVKNLPQNLAEWLLKAITKVLEWRQNLKEKGKEAIKSLIQSVIDGAKELPAKMAEIGINIVKGVWQGVQNMIGWFKNQISSFFSGIVSGAKSALGIHSPSTKFAWIGEMCVEGFEEPFDDYDPYSVLNTSAKASLGTLQADFEGTVNGDAIDYEKYADATVDAFERAGFAFKANNRELGRFVRGAMLV